jgi:hypothetical protein
MKKNLILLFAFLIATTTIISCSNDDDAPTPPGASMAATIDGQAWSSVAGGAIASISTINIGTDSNTVLQIIGVSQSFSSVSIQIPFENLSVGTFNFTSNSDNIGLLAYTNQSTSIYNSSNTGGNFSVTISSLNLTDGLMSGSFSGTLKDFDGNSIAVSNGSFTSVSIISSAMYSNGTMSLKANNGSLFTMDNDNTDGKYFLISESTSNNQLNLAGYNLNNGNDLGVYGLNFPLNVASGTYNLLSSNFGADIANNDNEPEFNLVSGSMTVTRNGKNLVGTFNYTATNGTRTVVVTNGAFDFTHK